MYNKLALILMTTMMIMGFTNDSIIMKLPNNYLNSAKHTVNKVNAQLDSYLSQAAYYKDKVAVLIYHHIDEKESKYTISPARFRQHLQALKDNHFNVISMETFIGFLDNKNKVPPNAVVITFDDGYESFYHYAYPELMKQNFTATSFVIVSYIDSNNIKLPWLKWKQIVEMKNNGFSFYSHTYNLHRLESDGKLKVVPDLSNPVWLIKEKRLETMDEYKKRVKNDLGLAEQILKQKLNNQLSLLCFPFGSYNKTVIDLAREVGIQYFFTGKDGINSPGNKEIFRIDAGYPYISAKNLISKLSRFQIIKIRVLNEK